MGSFFAGHLMKVASKDQVLALLLREAGTWIEAIHEISAIDGVGVWRWKTLSTG